MLKLKLSVSQRSSQASNLEGISNSFRFQLFLTSNRFGILAYHDYEPYLFLYIFLINLSIPNLFLVPVFQTLCFLKMLKLEGELRQSNNFLINKMLLIFYFILVSKQFMCDSNRILTMVTLLPERTQPLLSHSNMFSNVVLIFLVLIYV